MKKSFTLGISPCPNDTFIFHALLSGLVTLPFEVELVMADVEELNVKAQAGVLDFTKLSVGVVPSVHDKYALLQSGAALGFGCGPLVVAKKPLPDEPHLAMDAKKHASIAIPGRLTTAHMLLEKYGEFEGARHEMLFSDVMGAVIDGAVDMGLIIHEGRFTYHEHGLHKVLDLGEWWEAKYAMPLPLGIIAAHRRVPMNDALMMERAIQASILYARTHPEASQHFITQHAQELAPHVTAAHIATFVNDYSIELCAQGRAAVNMLVGSHKTPDHSFFLHDGDIACATS